MNNRHFLKFFLQNLQNDQLFLQKILSIPMSDALRNLLHAHQRECAMIETDAAAIAAERGWSVFAFQAGTALQADYFIKYRILTPKGDHRIASAHILHHTKSMIRVFHWRNLVLDPDSRISNLTQCYLDCLASTFHLLQKFL